MEVITIQTESFRQLIDKIENINAKVDSISKEQGLLNTWLTISKACEVLYCSKRSLQNYRDKGLIKFSKVGNKIYFKSDDIMILLENHKVQ